MTTIERIEKGETPLTTLEPDQIRQWAKTLGINPARLTGETPQEGEDGTTVIRRMRTKRGWSCPQLAEHANVPYRSLRQYDSGERDTANMAAGILARVAIALDTSMEKLSGRRTTDHATDDPPAGWTGTRLAWHRTRQGLPPGRTRHPGRTDHADHRRHRDPPVGHRQQKRSRIILDLAAAGLGIQALDLMDQTPEGKPRMNDPKPAKTEHSATADDLVYRNHVNAAIDQLRLALRTADTGERIRLLTGAHGQYRQRHRTARPIRLGRQSAPAKEMNGGPTKTARAKTRRRGRTVPTAFPASFIPVGSDPVHAGRSGMNILPDRSMWRNP